MWETVNLFLVELVVCLFFFFYLIMKLKEYYSLFIFRLFQNVEIQMCIAVDCR